MEDELKNKSWEVSEEGRALDKTRTDQIKLNKQERKGAGSRNTWVFTGLFIPLFKIMVWPYYFLPLLPSSEEAGKQRCSANSGNQFFLIPGLSPRMIPPSPTPREMKDAVVESQKSTLGIQRLPGGVKSGKGIKAAGEIPSLNRWIHYATGKSMLSLSLC